MQLISTDEPQIVNGRSQKRRSSVIRTVRVNRVLALLIALSLAVLGGVVAFACLSGKYFRIGGATYYFVQFSEHATLQEAQVYAERNRQHGGAGYILNDGAFRVMGACYFSEGEAITVAEKQEGGAQVYAVAAEGIRRPVVADKAAGAAIKSAFSTHETTCKAIQTVLFAYDRGQQSESVMFKAIADEIKSLKARRERMEGYYQQTGRTEFKLIAENYAECTAALSNAASGTSGAFSARVKHALIEILLLRTELSESIAILQ